MCYVVKNRSEYKNHTGGCHLGEYDYFDRSRLDVIVWVKKHLESNGMAALPVYSPHTHTRIALT